MMTHFLLVTLFSFSAYAVDWQGHRGARGLYPENTIGAMEEALKYPVTTLELDVVVSKDLQVVVSHEPWMNEEICLNPEGKKVKGKEYNLFKLTYEEIQKFDCGSIPHPRFPMQQKITVGKPTLDKLLDVTEKRLKELNREKIVYNIEIKSLPEDEKAGFQPDVKTFSDVVLKSIKNKLPESKYTIQSFDWRVLQYIHTAYPEVKLVALYEGPRVSIDTHLKNLGFNPHVFSPYYEDLKIDDVTDFHRRQIKVIPWTVNDVKSMEKMLSFKVDGIITDYPNLISEVGSGKCKKKTHFFEGKCVKVPSHAVPSSENPGLMCKPGYVQKRMGCEKIKIPKNASLLEDGKTWACHPGYERYRGTCNKKN